MRSRWLYFIPVALVLQALAVALISGAERLPAHPDFAAFPAALGDWQFVREDILSDGVARTLGADARITNTYTDRRTGLSADLLVAWFQSQRGGASQPHSPKVCLPATGWTPQATTEITLSFPTGPITVNRLLMAGNNQRAAVTYWYQTPRRVLAGEWESKFWLAADALRDRRSDTTLVRILVWAGPHGDAEATEAALRLTKSVYPLLRTALPK